MSPAYLPHKYVRVQAYLLDEGAPPSRVVLGLEGLREFDLHTGPSGHFLIGPDQSHIPLTFKHYHVHEAPDLPIPRLTATVLFEPTYSPPNGRTLFQGAIVDTGAPYTIVPYGLHKSNLICVHQDLGRRYYKLPASMTSAASQRFVELGIKFLAVG